jgi:hypothetical protein
VEEKGRVRKHRGGESDHSTGYVCMGISQWNAFVYFMLIK